jgi:glycosyltransferase involved in cell wall biosynthesis
MISAVIPVYNEKESLDKFYPRLTDALKKIDNSYEIIFIDDGSTDNSLEILKEFAKNDKKIKIYSFRRNQGKAEALTYGFRAAKGENFVSASVTWPRVYLLHARNLLACK